MASLQNLNRYAVENMSLGLREIHEQNEHMGFQIGGSNNSSAGGGMDQWRLQQIPFFNGFESASASSYHFQNESIEIPSGLVGDLSTNSRVSQMPSVKIEESGALNLSRSPLNVSENNHYYSWTDMLGDNPSFQLGLEGKDAGGCEILEEKEIKIIHGEELPECNIYG
ncbi:hypothetical protein LR48_Vigan06g098000 [Vigna angularis]|uniref:Uncharacterized protein n=1 Tax=Phaseolus angularis TaxID=3914 RepID=A0A0L9USZ9_PHAAN|nr:uncharacterized protein HKW66_Vig0241940 [Vigna angularis]KOM45674.1 hypothetical protein LR48_Vigan06g098000 [Vigna angularis]